MYHTNRPTSSYFKKKQNNNNFYISKKFLTKSISYLTTYWKEGGSCCIYKEELIVQTKTGMKDWIENWISVVAKLDLLNFIMKTDTIS
jgi:hypothetical protein